MLYAVSYKKNPEIYEEAFWAWDTKHDIGYELFDIDYLMQDVSIFNTAEEAEAFAKEVLREIWFDEAHVVAIDPDTEDTAFVKTVRL